MRLSAEARLREIAAHERDYAQPIALPEASIDAIEAAAVVCLAAEALIEDIRLRHPGEDLKCPYVLALVEALARVEEA